MKAPEELLSALKAAQSVALITHVNPDGDGLGAEAALAEAFEALGKKVFIANQDETPEKFAFLGLSRYQRPQGPVDLALVVDTSALERVGAAAKAVLDAAKETAVVDHHSSKPEVGRLRWVVPSAAAAGELAAHVVEGLGVKLTPAMATALFAAISWDTGCFRYSNAGPETLEMAARLKRAGADSDLAHREMFESTPERAVRLLNRALAGLKISDGGRSAHVEVMLKDLAELGAKKEDCDQIVEAARAVAGVEVSAFLREDEGSVKLSLRSKSDLDVNKLAGQFGGGGHVRAAGATLRMPLAEARQKVAAAVTAALAGA